LGIIRTDIAENFFSAQQTASGKLSILVGMDSFCYAIYTSSGQLVFIRRMDFPDSANFRVELPAIEQDNPVLFFPYSQVNIAFGAPAHAVVPSRLFDPAASRVYLEHGNRMNPTDRVCSGFLPEFQAHLVYAVPLELDVWLQRHFPRSTVLHLSQALLKSMAEDNSGKRVFAHFWDKRLMLAYFEGNQLVFENWFFCRDTKDFLYYLLLVFDKFQLDQAHQEVSLSGTLLAESGIFQLLEKYIRNLRFIALGEIITYGKKMSSLPPHFFNDLNAIVQFRPTS